jgi:hypothetical protein
MRSVLRYLATVLFLGCFSGVFMSMGYTPHMLGAIGFMCFFWAGMLTEML